MSTYKGTVITTWKNHEYVVVFRKGNKTDRCFKYINSNGLFKPSNIRDPLNWVEDCDPIAVPRNSEFQMIYGDPFLWDAMNLLEHKIKNDGW